MKAICTANGSIFVENLNSPEIIPGHVRIRTEYSAISPGTEMTIVNRAGENQAYLGYSAVGIVEQTGDGVVGIETGQRVACYGAPFVRHAEQLLVPANLTAPVPDHVDPRGAAFAGLGAIAIHALRTADLRFGESAVVVGLGILGNLIVQIAEAASLRTAGIDPNTERSDMLRGQGAKWIFEDPEQLENQLAAACGQHGADAVILCAGGPGQLLINQAFHWIRDRGKIVIVGDLTAEFSRSLMFGKEAQVLISRAGGPGRYDPQYERENKDYPIGYVRWTEGRNTAEYIRLLAERKISVHPLITDVYPIDQAAEAYANYRNRARTIATLIQYN